MMVSAHVPDGLPAGAPVPTSPIIETLRELAEQSMVVGYTTVEGRVSEEQADDLARRYQELGHAALDVLADIALIEGRG